MGAVAALLWAVAHLVVHSGRGWPMDVPGEWDLLLTALAIAGGDAPDAALGTLHGNELGGYLVAALVAIPVSFGADAVAAAKWVALGFGAGAAAVVGWLAAWLGLRADLGAREAALGALVSGLIAAVAWPGLHFELAGMNGRTPESLLPQLAAVALLVTTRPGIEAGALGRRAVGVGALLCLGLLLSPVTLWTLAACGAAGMVLLRSWPERAVALGGAVAGLLAPLLGFAVFVPGGMQGLELFLMEQFGGLGVTAEESGARAGLSVFGQVAGALEGGAHNPDLLARAWVLGGVGWALLLGLGAVIAARGRAWAAVRSPEVLAAAVGLSWLVPLVLLPTDKWFYPLAYRYWVLMLAVGMAVVPVSLLRAGAPGRVGALVLMAGALVCAPSLPRSIVAPSPTRAEALVSTGAHRMNARPGYERHAAFRALFRHAPAAAQPALAEGYGLALGGDLAVDVQDDRVGELPWVALRGDLRGSAYGSFLVGVGCGVTAVREVPDGVVALLAEADPEDRSWLLWGLGRCAGDREFPQVAEDPAFAAGRARRPHMGARSTTVDPARLMPPRW